MKRLLHLNLFIMGRGHHEAGWRHPLGGHMKMSDFSRYLNYAQTAERGLFDSVFLADILSLNHGGKYTPTGELEPLTVLAALAASTKNIGLVATASTSYFEPFNLARQFASIDHISHGRVGWNIVTSWAKNAEANFGLDTQPSHESRYSRAWEFMEVVTRLWDSWEADAIVDNPDTGVYLDTRKVSAINHKGEHYSVRGPLNIERSPQGRPVFFQAGSSSGGIKFAAAHAEAIFTAQPDLVSAQSFYREIKMAVEANGRRPEHALVFPGISPVIAESDHIAAQILEELNELTSVETGLERLSSRFGGYDFSSLPLDAVLSPDDLPSPESVQAAQSRAAVIVKYVKTHRPTLRELLRFMSGARGHFALTGSPEKIADTVEEWFVKGAADGFNLMPPIMPVMLDRFVDEVIPLLQKKGIFRTKYDEINLRKRLNLSSV